jgi:hypothetical protein
MRTGIVFCIAMIAVFAGIASASFVGNASIYAPAVILQNNTGSLTRISVIVTTGNGLVNVVGPSSVNDSTVQSAITAARYASAYLHRNMSSYDFNYTIADYNNSVSGPSAGAAMTLLAISAISGKPIARGFTITGTISANGGVGEVGGVLDKSGAAERGGLGYILVPAAAGDTYEQMLYQLVQDSIGIPLIQIANMSQAVQYAINGQQPVPQQVIYNPYVNYSVSALPSAPFSCSNGCSMSEFAKLASFTNNFTSTEIGKVAQKHFFANVSSSLASDEAQNRQLTMRGYYYTGADLSFMDYMSAYYFNSYSATPQSALMAINKIQAFCASLTPPGLTRQNYEYVLGGELRQAWGSYTLDTELADYNTTNIDSDTVLQFLYSAGEANAWCNAANESYAVARSIGGQPVNESASLAAVAKSRIKIAAAAGGDPRFLTSAIAADNQSNYAEAILETDYILSPSAPSGISTAEAIGTADAVARNSTYGVWGTEFANDAEFYISEARMSSNSNATQALSYAKTAYSIAQFAGSISNDTSLIYSSLHNITVQNVQQTSIQQNTSAEVAQQNEEILQGIRQINSELIGVIILLGVFGVLMVLFALEVVARLNVREYRDSNVEGHRRRKR